jgi:tetratricopeptide (TPR) repeat protein
VRDEHYQFSFQLTEHAGELANSGMGLTHYFLGNHSRAMHSVDQAVRELKQSKHNNSLGLAMFYQSFLLMEYGLNEDAERVADELINFSMEQTLPQWVAAGVVVKGATVSRTADQRGGIELILKGIDDWRMTSNQFHIPQFYLYLAQAYLINHQFDEGLEAIRMAHEQADRTGEHWFTAELHRTEAELLLARRRDSMPVIEETLGRALEVARNQHSKTFELRAAMSLAKVWAERGEQSRARNLLEPVYGWFKEGTDTRDLIEARNLLDQLR